MPALKRAISGISQTRASRRHGGVSGLKWLSRADRTRTSIFSQLKGAGLSRIRRRHLLSGRTSDLISCGQSVGFGKRGPIAAVRPKRAAAPRHWLYVGGRPGPARRDDQAGEPFPMGNKGPGPGAAGRLDYAASSLFARHAGARLGATRRPDRAETANFD